MTLRIPNCPRRGPVQSLLSLLRRGSSPSLTSDAVVKLFADYGKYLHGLRSSSDSQKLLREAFVATNGFALDAASILAQERYASRSPSVSPNSNRTAINLHSDEKHDAVTSLEERGWWLAPRLLSAEQLLDFEAFGLGLLRTAHPDVFNAFSDELNPQRAGQLLGGMHSLNSSALLEHSLALLAFDGDLIDIAHRYLGVRPVLSQPPNAWFSFPVSEVDQGSAQNWHWDCDRIKWLKVFVYATDVSDSNGPHAFIETSHRRLRISSKDSRYTDAAVNEAYPGARRDFTAQRGQILIEDTKGLHRGQPVLDGYRFILQFEYAIDYYGAVTDIRPIHERFPESMSPDGVL